MTGTFDAVTSRSSRSTAFRSQSAFGDAGDYPRGPALAAGRSFSAGCHLSEVTRAFNRAGDSGGSVRVIAVAPADGEFPGYSPNGEFDS